MKGIRIYMEGGGDTASTLTPFRQGATEFFRRALNASHARPIDLKIIACGGRTQAYEHFCDALQNYPDTFNILLVDSEDPIAINVPPWQHLLNRIGDGWTCPVGAEDEHCHFMVACMEAWFLADHEAVSHHFGHNFNPKKLQASNLAESRTKDQIKDSLDSAVSGTRAREYKKIRDGAKLLAKIDPAKVREHCQWCARLFTTLGEVIGHPGLAPRQDPSLPRRILPL